MAPPVPSVKSRVFHIADGCTYLSGRFFPTRARLALLRYDYRHGRLDWDDVNQCIQSWIGHASHADTWRLREKIFHFSQPSRQKAKKKFPAKISQRRSH